MGGSSTTSSGAIVALRAGAFEEDRQMGLAIGMDYFLTKPVTLAQLTSALDKWLPCTSSK
jgi:CheY-like chemotaxis protein